MRMSASVAGLAVALGLLSLGSVAHAGTIQLDHFKCYKVKGEDVKVTVQLRDQFDDPDFKDALVVKPEFLCNPTDKIHGANQILRAAGAHLVCYKIVTAKGNPPDVFINNQFQSAVTLEVKTPKLLCVPSQKFLD
jgi:hypothetical protein